MPSIDAIQVKSGQCLRESRWREILGPRPTLGDQVKRERYRGSSSLGFLLVAECFRMRSAVWTASLVVALSLLTSERAHWPFWAILGFCCGAIRPSATGRGD